MHIARILCPTDFSDASAHAIDQAVVIAGWYKARITALHVGSFVTPSVDETSPGRLRDETAAFFEGARAAGIPVDVRVEVGRPASHILDCAAALPADLIVLGTHGSSGFEHLVLGSVTEKVLRQAACPVLTVPPRAQATSRLPFRRLLCAIDFSDSSITALQYAVSLAGESQAALTLLHVLEWPWEEPPPPALEMLPVEQRLALTEYRRYCETSAMARLESLVPAAAHLRCPPVARLSHGKAYVQILQVAAETHADLIVIGVRGRNPVDLTLFGSTANQIVRRATCPVLTLRSKPD
jgi:nucleotide-binding universal stress UspA family protein